VIHEFHREDGRALRRVLLVDDPTFPLWHPISVRVEENGGRDQIGDFLVGHCDLQHFSQWQTIRSAQTSRVSTWAPAIFMSFTGIRRAMGPGRSYHAAETGPASSTTWPARRTWGLDSCAKLHYNVCAR
jgi:hypothetical protein